MSSCSSLCTCGMTSRARKASIASRIMVSVMLRVCGGQACPDNGGSHVQRLSSHRREPVSAAHRPRLRGFFPGPAVSPSSGRDAVAAGQRGRGAGYAERCDAALRRALCRCDVVAAAADGQHAHASAPDRDDKQDLRATARDPWLRRHRDERPAVRRRHAVCGVGGSRRRCGGHNPHADPRAQGGRRRGRAHHLPHGGMPARCGR